VTGKEEREDLPSFHIFPASKTFQIFPIILAMHACSGNLEQGGTRASKG
jgi:hypothetical protein